MKTWITAIALATVYLLTEKSRRSAAAARPAAAPRPAGADPGNGNGRGSRLVATACDFPESTCVRVFAEQVFSVILSASVESRARMASSARWN